MKYAFLMVSGTMIYKPNFIKINSGIQILMVGEDTQTRDSVEMP
jgi:hypothetical protein